MSLPRLFDGIFSNEIVGVIVTLGDFDLPLAGVSVQEPKIEKMYSLGPYLDFILF